ncbi:MAG: hypothetical protein GY756_20450 [bacterium]|nr:hypothetical protein [bacterium]
MKKSNDSNILFNKIRIILEIANQMTLPKKGLRKIIVDNFQYGWSATGNAGWISLSVSPLNNPGQ